MKTSQSEKLFQKAKNYFPGGVNSPVRAFRSVFGNPLFIEKGNGCHIWDADGNKYLDFCCSWGPLILGHNHPKVRAAIIKTVKNGTSFGAPTQLENELAELILKKNKCVEKIRFVSSGTEAVMSAIRLARGFTKKNKIIKFDGCYHGHSDSLLVKAGSGLATFGISSSDGVPPAFANETIVLPLNEKEAVERTFQNYKNEIACVIIEPIPANNGLMLQEKSYLEFLRKICTQSKTLLIFDEVISGFRVGFGGAAAYYQIQPDIITYGKVIGGGMPVGAYAASRELMNKIAPEGTVYQAGTLSGNPVAMAAGIAQLKECAKKSFYKKLEAKTRFFVKEIFSNIQTPIPNFQIFYLSSIFWFAFTQKKKISRADEINSSGMIKYKLLHHELLKRGVYFAPSGYEVGFVSAAHTEKDLKIAAKIIGESVEKIARV